MHAVTHPAALFGYSTGGAVLTVVLPLGLFIVVMIALYFVFSRRRMPERPTIVGAKPVAPDPQTAREVAAASGFPTATSGGGAEPLADRATPPRAGALREDIPGPDGDDTVVSELGVSDTAVSDPGADDTPTGGTAVADPE